MIGKKPILCLAVFLTLLSVVADSSKVSASVVTDSSNVSAAVIADSSKVSVSAPKQFEELEFDKAYNEDLDYDGEEEKVICKQTDVENDESKKKLTVYINDNIVFNKTLKCERFSVHLADINVDDNVQDLFITTHDVGPVCLKTYYLQYKDSKLKLIQTIKRNDGPKYFNMATYFFGDISDDSSFQLIANRPIGDAIGDYECIISYQLINGKLSAVKTNNYNLTSYSKKYVYKAEKKFVAYKSVYTGAAAVFTVNSGDEVRADKVYVSDEGKCYIRIINSKNVKGWIDGSQENLFERGPICD